MRRPRLADVLDGLRRARTDDRVRALVAKVGGRRMGLAQVQELRAADQRVRPGTGKLAVAWAETFGDFSPGNVPYYLATAFDRIYLQPSGDLGLTGISVQNWFYRGAMDKLGIEFQVGKREEYKSAAERFTEQRLHRAGPGGPAADGRVHRGADHRGDRPAAGDLRRGDARALIDSGPFMASEALDARLVDALGYRDEVYAAVRRRPGPDAHLLFLGRYQRARVLAERTRTLPRPGEDAVALIYATGPIRRGRSARGPLLRGPMGSDTLSAALRSATADHRVKAIVLRVNSPGGSYVASDTIWRETVRAREAGKTVVVSMGEVAASGGYFIAMAADAIIAQPGTITGSIGVLSGKPVLRPGAAAGRGDLGRGHRGRARGHVHRVPPVQRGGVGQDQQLAGPDLRRLHQQGRGRPRADRGAGARGGQGPGVDRRGRYRHRAGRLSWAGWTPRWRGPAQGGAARLRAGADLPAQPPAGPAPAAGVQRGPRPPPAAACSPRPGARFGSWPPTPACRPSGRCCCPGTG